MIDQPSHHQINRAVTAAATVELDDGAVARPKHPYLPIQLAQTVIDDRLREADEYRQGLQARRNITPRSGANGRGRLLARLSRGKDPEAPPSPIGRTFLRLASIGRSRVRPEESGS